MALPRVNETLNFSMKIPSTGKNVKFRPYLVKEEKVLLQAFESGDLKTCLEAMVDTLESCIDEKSRVDVASLATFDVEYMFTQVRAKSVGESSSITIKCDGCETENVYMVDLETLEVDAGKEGNVVAITDDVSVEMRYPTYNALLEGDADKMGEDDPESALALIAGSIEAVLTPEERIDCRDQSQEEIVDFINSMTASQLQHISKFLEEMPALKHTAEFECKNCGKQNKLELKGLADFF